MSFINTTLHDDVIVLEIDNPPVNALSAGVPEALEAALGEAERHPRVRAVVVRAAGRTFTAGADITTLEAAAWGDEAAAADLHLLLKHIEDLTKPVVMAIHGTALGGGLEVAMAAHYRVALRTAQLGSPEVNLGIIPGAEATQRLPRLVGVEKALELLVTGRPVSAEAAFTAGLIDEVIDGDLTADAVAFARRAAERDRHVKTRDRQDRLGTPDVNAPLFTSARELARKVRRHQTAPLKAVDAVEAATSLAFDAGCRRERELFFECVRTEQAKAMIHLFFAERAATKLPDDATGGVPRPVRHVAIIGAGTMGGGIAMACTNAGLQVSIADVSSDALESGLARVRSNYDVSVSRGRLTADAVNDRMARIRRARHLAESVASADLVIEAAYEDLALKLEIFREVDRAAPAHAILATNTSTLDVDTIADVTSRPASVVGLHFFSPAHVMRLLEVVRGRRTSADVLATALAVSRDLRKLGVVVGNGPGFVGNRLMFPYMYEAQFLVEEGATPADVDRALTDFGMAMGMFAVDDMAGLDVGWRVKRALGHFRNPTERRPLVHDRLVEAGRLGQKRGKGWYRYDDPRKPTPDPEVQTLIESVAVEAGIERRAVTPREIVERSIYALVNEGARTLQSGVATRASDIDVIYVNGYGFPAWRGGPMFYADRVGLPVVLERVTAFHREHGARWEPAPLLVELAQQGGTFREWSKARRG